MPDFVSCPKCGCRVQVLVGSSAQRVRCIACDHRFEVKPPGEPGPAERLPPLDAVPVDEPPPRREPPSLPDRSPRPDTPPEWWRAAADLSRRYEQELSLRPLLEADLEGLPFCPGCGRRVRWEAVICNHCGEEFEDDRDLRARHRAQPNKEPERRDATPHRAGMIATLGNISMMLGIFSLCFGASAVFALPLGIIAWVMANGDLEAMRNGYMNSRGRKQTEQGRSNAITGVVFSALFAFVWILLWLCVR